MDRRDGALTRLILVVVSWSEWQPERDRPRYEQFIDTFLRGSPKHSADGHPAYMHQCYEKAQEDGPSAGTHSSNTEAGDNDIDVTPWVEQEAPYELPPKYHCPPPHVWLAGNDALRRVAFVPQTERVPEGSKLPVHQVTDWGRLFRTRVFMDADWYRSVTECGGESSYWVLIDMRFQQVSTDSILWHNSFSFWSAPPWCRHHCPRDIYGSKGGGLKDEDAYNLMAEWNTRAVEVLRGHDILKDLKAMRVFGRSYKPPNFLVAVPEQYHRDTAAPHEARHGKQRGAFPQVSNEIVWTQNYEALPQALLKGGISAFRRFLPYADIDLPRYLLIPDTWTPTFKPKYAGRWHEIQEEAAGEGARILTDLEAYAANELGGINSRMQIRRNHLKIYQGVAEQAGTLWDALARLLPDARKGRLLPRARQRGLEIVHQSIEMLHLTLLQGVADLDQLVRNINGAGSRIEFTADEVADRFDRRLDHPPSDPRADGPPSQGREPVLRDSLRGGPLDRLRRQVKEASTDADRVTESYRMLLETIGMAFDERRVRDGDRLQRASVWLAAAFGVLGLAGVVQATFPVQPLANGDYRVSYIRWGLWLIAIVVILAILILPVTSQLGGKVASRKFEKRYRKMRDFLAEVSTDHLDDFRRKEQSHEQRSSLPVERGYPTTWEKLDERLSEKFVGAWTTASKAKAKALTGRHRYGAARLRYRVQAWTLQTLILTERPRDFSRYQLPYLTSLYRICTKKVLAEWRDAEEMPNADSAVGTDELNEALSNGYKWLIANEENHIAQEAKDVYEWLKTDAPWGVNRMNAQRQLMKDYLDAFSKRADFPRYLAEDVVVIIEGTDQRADGREAAEQMIRHIHEQAFDTHPELKNLLVDDGKAATEADFAGIHTGEFAGVQATGRAVRVPYSVVYDLRDDQISKLRIYFPMKLLMEQLIREGEGGSMACLAEAGTTLARAIARVIR